jgi:hypothetical protein
MRRALIACALAALPAWAAAQATGACTVPDHVPPARLSGLWTLTLWPENGSQAQATSRGALLFERHPDYAASVRGELKRDSPGNDLIAIVSGDVTEGEFHLDESADGQTMAAVWSGTAEDCGGRLTITGTRRPADGPGAPEPVLRFRLHKPSGWR